MPTEYTRLWQRKMLLFVLVCAALPCCVRAATCKAESQIASANREEIAASARTIAGELQRAEIAALRARTIAAVTDFSGISAMVEANAAQVHDATATIDSLYLLDATTEEAGATRVDFYCGSPLVVLNINDLPAGRYAFVILHMTGVAHPQQLSLILSAKGDHEWMLAGMFVRPMLEAGHAGQWYWQMAQQYAARQMRWTAWFYFRLAAATLQPVEFVSSPNLDAIQQQQDRVHPENLPGTDAVVLASGDARFEVTSVDTTDIFGTLDLDVHYRPDAAALGELRDATTARKQVKAVMTALLDAHPELREGFHGIWLQADHDNATVFSLELPMSDLNGVGDAQTGGGAIVPAAAGLRNPTNAETQMSLAVDRDPIALVDEEAAVTTLALSAHAEAEPGEVRKVKEGLYTMHKDVDEVLLNCAVVDEKGHPVRALSRENFTVWEDGRPQFTSSFLHQDQPVALGILVDNSGSMIDKHAVISAAALTMVQRLNPQDRTFVVNFSETAFLDQEFTNDVDALSRGLARFQSRGSTALYDAVASSADELAKHGAMPKQVLLVITDGADNGSHLTLEQTIKRVQGLGGPVVYAIGLLYEDDKQEAQRARAALEQLAEQTGGVAYFPRSLEDVKNIGIEVAEDIRDQYTVGYQSSKPAALGGYRTVMVKASTETHQRLIVRTRKGYLAAKPTTVVKADAMSQVR